MKRTLPSVALGLLVVACARPSQPALQPTPAGPAAQTASSAGPARDSAVVAPQGVAIRQRADSATRPVAHAPARGGSPSALADSAAIGRDASRRAAEMFGDSAIVRSSAADSAAPEPTWDIDVRPYESSDRVEHYVRVFTTTAKERIQARLERGTRYEPMIRAKMREGGLPEDMYYLALVESGFDPNAYSRAAAVGMWQFMTSTARDMGLRVDWWVDERRDPMKSTDAAVKFIRDLKEQFGSLYLAAAAYNGGPGRIARGLSRYADDFEGTSGDDLFFALADKDYLRNETREYVPQLIAAALIAKEPDRYGLQITPQPPFVYDSVRVGPGTPLAAIGRAANATTAQIQELNPQILRGVTPPKDSSFIRIPAGQADSFAVAFAALPDSLKIGLHHIESKKGQSIGSIAGKYGIPARQLALFNPKVKTLKSGNLAAGQTIVVPTPVVAGAAVAVPDPSIERYGSTSSKSVVTHVVKSGETIGAIAKKYNTTTAAIMRANGMKRALIFPGQSIIVKGGGRAEKKGPGKGEKKKGEVKRGETKKGEGKKGEGKKSVEKSGGKKSVQKRSASRKKRSGKKKSAD